MFTHLDFPYQPDSYGDDSVKLFFRPTSAFESPRGITVWKFKSYALITAISLRYVAKDFFLAERDSAELLSLRFCWYHVLCWMYEGGAPGFNTGEGFNTP